MMNTRNVCQRRGFSLIECGALVLVLSMIGMTVAPSLQSVRSQQRGNASAANLMSIGQSAAVYGFFNQGRLFSYSWRAGETYVMPDGQRRTPNSDEVAAADQNQEILKRRSGRIQGLSKIRLVGSRIPHLRWNHVVLMDFLNEPLESTRFIDPADANQLFWTANPLEYLEEGNSVPYGSGNSDDFPLYDDDNIWLNLALRQRWAFGTSYHNTPDSWQQDFPNLRYRPFQDTPHRFILFGNDINLHSGRNITEVAFPSQKVWIHEEFDREQAGSPYFGYAHARAEKLMFDGSVNNWSSGDANASVVSEVGLQPWKQMYVPLHTFPVPMGGLGDERLISQRYRWTFRGLGGVDYGPAVTNRGPRTKNP